MNVLRHLHDEVVGRAIRQLRHACQQWNRRRVIIELKKGTRGDDFKVNVKCNYMLLIS